MSANNPEQSLTMIQNKAVKLNHLAIDQGPCIYNVHQNALGRRILIIAVHMEIAAFLILLQLWIAAFLIML